MNIVVLDGHTMNPGDLSWDALSALGPLTVHERTAPQEVVPRAGLADAVLTNKTVLGRAELLALPRLRYVGLLSTGTNVVDLAAAHERGLVVTNVPSYSTEEVAQATFALMLSLTNHVAHYDRAVHAGRWTDSRDFSFVDPDQRPVALSGRTLGLIGLGLIGQAVARIGLAFGMRVAAATRSGTAAPGIDALTVEELLPQSDIISLHCPLTEETRHIIGRRTLPLFRPHALLINTARGGLVDADVLAHALNEGRIGGAALDVLDEEPPPADHPLLHARNCLLTPHIAWAAHEARARLMREVVENLRAFVGGHSRNRVTCFVTPN